MTYRRVATAKAVEHENNCTIHPKATIADEYGGRYHICIDDGCYVVYCESAETGLCRLVTHIFPELFEVLREMPPLERRIEEDDE